MLGDIKPTLELNLLFQKQMRQPEVKLEVVYENEKIHYVVKNVSEYTAYQVSIFAYEDHYEETSLQLIAQVGDVLEPKETKTVTSNVQYPFVGCMSYKEYWVEFSDVEGKHYKFTSGSDNTGISLVGNKQIKERTKIYGIKKKRKNKLKIISSNLIYRFRYALKI